MLGPRDGDETGTAPLMEGSDASLSCLESENALGSAAEGRAMLLSV